MAQYARCSGRTMESSEVRMESGNGVERRETRYMHEVKQNPDRWNITVHGQAQLAGLDCWPKARRGGMMKVEMYRRRESSGVVLGTMLAFFADTMRCDEDVKWRLPIKETVHDRKEWKRLERTMFMATSPCACSSPPSRGCCRR